MDIGDISCPDTEATFKENFYHSLLQLKWLLYVLYILGPEVIKVIIVTFFYSQIPGTKAKKYVLFSKFTAHVMSGKTLQHKIRLLQSNFVNSY